MDVELCMGEILELFMLVMLVRCDLTFPMEEKLPDLLDLLRVAYCPTEASCLRRVMSMVSPPWLLIFFEAWGESSAT